MKEINKVFRWIRISCSSIFILAVCFLVIWNYAPYIIDKIDNKLVQKYEEYYQRQFNNAEALIVNGEKLKGIESLEVLIAKLDEVQVSDRLDSLKRSVFPLLITNLVLLKDVKKAFHWAEQWLIFHPNDLKAQIIKAQIIIYHTNKPEEGRELLSKLYKKYFLSPMVKAAYEKMVLARLIALNKRKIPLYWKSEGENFSEYNKVVVEMNSRIESGLAYFDVSFPVGDDVSQFRIDLPNILPAEYAIDDIELEYLNNQKVLIPITRNIIYKQGLDIKGDKLTLLNDSPRFVVDVGNIGLADNVKSIRLSGKIK